MKFLPDLRRPGIAACVVAVALLAAAAFAEPPGQVPNPRVRDGSWVTDAPGALSPGTRARIDTLLTRLEHDTGAEVGVAIVTSLDGLTVEEYAVRLFEAWAIGKRGQDNGVLFLWSPADRRMRIEVGYGLEPVITDGRAGALLDRYVVPEFKSGAFDRGVYQGVEAIAGLIRKQSVELPSSASTVYDDPAAAPVPSQARARRWTLLLSTIGGLVGAVASFFGWRRWKRLRPRRCSACGGPMTRLAETADDEYLEEVQRLEERIGSVDYDVWKCRDCADRVLLRYPRWFTRFGKCRQCGNRTCGRTEVTLVAATTASAGAAEVTERCEFCTYRHVYRRVIPRITTSSGGSSGGGRSGGGSFGGGRSGGGGASRGY